MNENKLLEFSVSHLEVTYSIAKITPGNTTSCIARMNFLSLFLSFVRMNFDKLTLCIFPNSIQAMSMLRDLTRAEIINVLNIEVK